MKSRLSGDNTHASSAKQTPVYHMCVYEDQQSLNSNDNTSAQDGKKRLSWQNNACTKINVLVGVEPMLIFPRIHTD